ncbi:cyclic nucleotide-binding domain-containing protein [Amphritea sp. HPY]|uniref:cyclic nucleotide-binding domain-containing protein n=1 Tax=Amphritea sp. HPY TaxID=3421652 RepID=UPI003D7EE52E
MDILTARQVSERFPLSRCRSLSLFGALSNDCISFLLDNGELGYSLPGEKLFQQGQSSGDFYIVLEGRLSYYRFNGVERVYLRSYSEGEQLGFASMIGLHERRGDAVTEIQGYVLCITADLFHQVCQNFSEDFVIFMINMTREMSREIIDLDSLCADLRTRVNESGG